MGAEPYKMQLQDGMILVSFKEGTEVTPDLIIELIRRESDMLGDDYLNALWDFRGCLPSDDFGYASVERIIDYITHYPQVQWNPRLAILVEPGVQYGLSRMYQTLVDEFPTEIGIFHEWAVAMAWVAGEKAQARSGKGPEEITD
jgi:hypothetical protein